MSEYKIKWYASILTLIVLVGLLVWKSQMSLPMAFDDLVSDHFDSKILNPVVKSPVKSLIVPASKGGESRILNPPSLDQVRKEIKMNPHDTPPSILAFASSLGPKMELALSSEMDSSGVFGELENCVLGNVENSSVSIRAACLTNAHILKQRYSELRSRYDLLLKKADREAVKLSAI